MLLTECIVNTTTKHHQQLSVAADSVSASRFRGKIDCGFLLCRVSMHRANTQTLHRKATTLIRTPNNSAEAETVQSTSYFSCQQASCRMLRLLARVITGQLSYCFIMFPLQVVNLFAFVLFVIQNIACTVKKNSMTTKV